MRKATRASTSKVRTGCVTCKKRRVKCDEGKPHCQRCVSTGRQCDGYVTIPPAASRKGLRMIHYYVPACRPSSALGGAPPFQQSGLEARSVDFFRERTAWCFPSEFSRCVLRAAHDTPVIWHAVIALGALHEGFEQDDMALTRFPLQHYGKALTFLLQSQTDVPTKTRQTALICCLLFTSFECLRGHHKAAVIHIKSGLKLLRESPEESACSRTAGAYVPYEMVRSLFTRLDNQLVEILGTAASKTFGEQEPGSSSQIVPPSLPPATSAAMDDASSAFDLFLNRVLRIQLHIASFLETGVRGVEDEETIAHLDAARVQCLEHLDEWDAFFRDYLHSSRPDRRAPAGDQVSFPATVLDRWKIIQIWLIMARIFMTVAPANLETECDDYIDEFRVVIGLAESIVNSRFRARSGSTYMPIFSINLGIVSAVFFVATRCRDGELRRRAIEVLFASKRREGVWRASNAADVAQRVMELEEASARKLMMEKSEAVGCAATQMDRAIRPKDVPPSVRVRSVTVVFNDENRARIEIDGTDTQRLALVSYPD